MQNQIQPSDLHLYYIHHIHLDDLQRRDLAYNKKPCKVLGVNTPIWVKKARWFKKPATEVFSNYYFATQSKETDDVLTMVTDGFALKLAPNMLKYLKDGKDLGSEHLSFSYSCNIQYEKEIVFVKHILQIDKMERLTSTLCWQPKEMNYAR